ncbi:hypothetical protein COS66_01315 [Candidatus Berkelbacteria bacterium CG06_land_8_20_14_3_00_43_10]|uniref:Nucleotidyl transferase AbiEii/AbiGii toxin family protein n=1 Tax=Candidatus Berkelbacteria bacterium CG10_big_fil_rev_8_21_14_0_10_43_14 TaxID=1974515 RepID=A0A2M6R8Q3_9BACT|nr:MAG: hypothetical protein AUK41_02075 [Candidatus Berkelbacteria bacterium CG2_30_43_20]PIS06978.1 MAG: hypothetical protein COT79_01770 [Candidatus Berkelbacteria bacterium CG10_big_fil_rev_8_21_14_0_10_43_14]PIU87352.1 MAG: hypothetical protein COS66_01315 [Candidatus Berkelbacteria bacterium CG06_land_8_20_14_3_00_43_10]
MSKKFSLPAWQKTILKAIATSDIGKIIVWGGGTALADMYLGHRRSFDLDFFVDNPLTNGEVDSILVVLRDLNIKKVNYKQEKNRWFYFVSDKNSEIKLEFVYYPFTRLQKPKTTEYGIKVESLTDLIANKTFALYERAEPKDVYDLYAIMQNRKMSLEKLLQLAHKKFGVDLDPVYFTAQITKAIEKVDLIKVLLFEKDDLRKELENYFVPKIKQLVLKRIPR